MAAVQGPDAALKAKVEGLKILQGECKKAEVRLRGAQGNAADLVISKIDSDVKSKIQTPRL